VTEQPDDPSTPPGPNGPGVGGVSRRHLLGGAGLLGLGAAAGAVAATAIHGPSAIDRQQTPIRAPRSVTGPHVPATLASVRAPTSRNCAYLPASSGYRVVMDV